MGGWVGGEGSASVQVWVSSKEVVRRIHNIRAVHFHGYEPVLSARITSEVGRTTDLTMPLEFTRTTIFLRSTSRMQYWEYCSNWRATGVRNATDPIVVRALTRTVRRCVGERKQCSGRAST